MMSSKAFGDLASRYPLVQAARSVSVEEALRLEAGSEASVTGLLRAPPHAPKARPRGTGAAAAAAAAPLVFASLHGAGGARILVACQARDGSKQRCERPSWHLTASWTPSP